MIMKHCIRSTWERINTSKVNLFLTTEKSQKVLKIFKQGDSSSWIMNCICEGANFYLEVSRLNRLKELNIEKIPIYLNIIYMGKY